MELCKTELKEKCKELFLKISQDSSGQKDFFVNSLEQILEMSHSSGDAFLTEFIFQTCQILKNFGEEKFKDGIEQLLSPESEDSSYEIYDQNQRQAEAFKSLTVVSSNIFSYLGESNTKQGQEEIQKEIEVFLELVSLMHLDQLQNFCRFDSCETQKQQANFSQNLQKNSSPEHNQSRLDISGVKKQQ